MIYIGIDPGMSGGLAIIDLRGVQAIVMANGFHGCTDMEILVTLERYRGTRARAAIEHVWSTPGQGGGFVFGKSVGKLQMALAAARIPFDLVLPRAWQKALGVVYRKGLTDTQKKNITKARAQQLFPELTVTHATADALLLAEYCRRMERDSHGKVESLTRTEGTYTGTGGKEGPSIAPGSRAVIIRPATEQGGGRASPATRADPPGSGPRAARAAGDGEPRPRPEDGRHLQARREPARRTQRPPQR